MEKEKPINVFEVKQIKRDFSFKISAADVFNEFLYVGDEKGNIYSYPIRMGDSEIIAKSTNEQTKIITKSRIDKLICYPAISSIIVLSEEKLFVIDSALRKPQQIAVKIHDFAINQGTLQQGQLHSFVTVSRKKEGSIYFLNPAERKFVEGKRFQTSDLPTCLGYTGSYIVMGFKKQYESLCVAKNFALKKGSMQAKSPFLKVTGSNEVLVFMDDIGLFMDGEFNPKQKDNVFVSKPISNITICGHYCLILCENLLQVYTTYDPKRFTAVQELPMNAIRGVTSDRPFVFGREEMYFLFEIPYQIQIKSLLERGRVDDAINLLIQNVGENEAKLQALKMDAIWFLIKRMQFDKTKQLIKSINFDVRQVILLYPELISLDIEAIKSSRAEKYMSTLIVESISEKAVKGKDDQTDLKKKSKLFLKEILEFKREQYLSRSSISNKVKITFASSKYSLIKPKMQPASAEEILEIIDFCLIRWFLDMSMFRHLEDFFQANPTIYCKKLYGQFQMQVRTNPKLVEFPTLKPRLLTAFDRLEQAFQSWKTVGDGKDSLVTIACEECVKLLAQFEDRNDVFKKLMWVLNRKPEIGMSFFSKVDLNFLQPDEIIRNFQQQKTDRYLELYLQTIVFEKKTEIEAYHTKLLLLYMEGLFKLHPKENKDEAKTPEFAERLSRMRKLLRSPEAKYASEPALKKLDKCEWLLEDQIFLYSREKRHEEALKKYISKNMFPEAEKYCRANGQQTLTVYFKMMLAIYRSYESSKNNSSLLLKKDIIIFLKKYSNDPELDALVVLELIPDNWMLNDSEGIGGIYQFLESAIIHTLHEKRTTYTSRHLSEMDLLNVEYNLIQAKRASLRFTYKKKCCICQTPISDNCFVVYPNANVCHQACVKKENYTICPVTKQDFEKTFKY